MRQKCGPSWLPSGQLEVIGETECLVDVFEEVQCSVHLLFDL